MADELKSLDSIKDIINRSGNNFHYQVVKFLREKGWSLLVSPYYTDNVTDKPREIDIIAEKAFDIKDPFMDCWYGTLNVKLFIECKYINSDIVFWLDDRDKNKIIEKIVADSPLKPPSQNITINEHRYLNAEKVAKLFASGKNNENNDVIYKALNQNLNALVYYRNKSDFSMVPERKGWKVNILHKLNYPLIVCNNFNNFYSVDTGYLQGEPKGIINNFQLEVNYAYLHITPPGGQFRRIEYFLMDVINFEKFDDFLNEIQEKDIRIISDTISEQQRHKNK